MRKLLVALFLCLVPSAHVAAQADDPPAAERGEMAQWVEALQDSDAQVCVDAVVALKDFGAPAVPALAEALGHASPEVRETAVAVLARVGPDAVEPLVQTLQAGDALQRAGAATVLGRIKPPPGEALGPLAEALKDAEKDVRSKSAQALAGFGPAAVIALLPALEDPEVEVRRPAAMALGSIGPESRAAIPTMVRFLNDEDQGLREIGTVVLGRMGADAAPALEAALASEHSEVRERAADALGRIGAQVGLAAEAGGAVAALAAALQDPEPAVCQAAAQALGQIGAAASGAAAAEAAVASLRAALEDADRGVRRDAAAALGNIGPAARDAVPDLIHALAHDENADVRVKAARALGSIDTESGDAIQALSRARTDDDAMARTSVAAALAQFGPSAVPELLPLLQDSDFVVRTTAADSLRRIAPDSLPETATDDAADPVRRTIERALARIEVGAVNWARNTKCFSCHHQGLPVWTLTSAAGRGFDVDPARARRQVQFSVDSFRLKTEHIRRGEGLRSGTTEAGYVLLALTQAGELESETAAAFVEFLLARQRSDGAWTTGAKRPPSEGSSFTATALAMRGLQAYAAARRLPADDAQAVRIQASLAKAREWLLANEPANTEDKVFRLHALTMADAGSEQVAAARDDLLADQRADGSWAPSAVAAGDAYATGSVLMALRAAGVETSSAAYGKGAEYLVATQTPEGVWFVRTRVEPVQIYFDNGDPGEKSQFLSFAATNWAVLALLELYPPRSSVP